MYPNTGEVCAIAFLSLAVPVSMRLQGNEALSATPGREFRVQVGTHITANPEVVRPNMNSNEPLGRNTHSSPHTLPT